MGRVELDYIPNLCTMKIVLILAGIIPFDAARGCGSVGLFLLHLMETRYLSPIPCG